MGQSLINSCLLLLYFIILISCYPYLESAVCLPPSSFATGVKERVAQKPLLRHILALKTNNYAFDTDQNYDEAQEILRSWRSSQVSSFLTDLWTNIMDFFPRSAIYAFLVSSAIISFLFCLTILVDDRSF
ncbi:small integral membrane protein 9 [Phascolarctos cinereus]